MCEWLKQAVLKTAVPERVPGVRIPLPPPRSLDCREILPLFPAKCVNMPVFSDFCATNRTGENGLLCSKWRRRPGFSPEGTRRMQCDHNAEIRPQRVDFCQRLGHGVRRVP